MLGGYNFFGSGAYVEKTFDLSGVPPHSIVRVELDFYKVDSWDNEWARLYLDGTLVWTQRSWNSDGSRYCGNGHRDRLMAAAGQISISAATVTVRVNSTLNEGPNNEAWGINNVRVFVR